MNWHALRAVGEHANQRLCDAQASDAQPAPDVVTLAEVTRPSVTTDGQPVPALRFGDTRVMALMAAIVGFAHLITGFDNKTLTGLMTSLLDQSYTTKQATYDLRRLRRKGLIERQPHSNRYLLTDRGRCVAVLSPRPTAGCSPPAWQPSTRGCQRTWPNEAHSQPPDAPSTANSRTT